MCLIVAMHVHALPMCSCHVARTQVGDQKLGNTLDLSHDLVNQIWSQTQSHGVFFSLELIRHHLQDDVIKYISFMKIFLFLFKFQWRLFLGIQAMVRVMAQFYDAFMRHLSGLNVLDK